MPCLLLVVLSVVGTEARIVMQWTSLGDTNEARSLEYDRLLLKHTPASYSLPQLMTACGVPAWADTALSNLTLTLTLIHDPRPTTHDP